MRIYIYNIYIIRSESKLSIPDNWTFWQRDNVCGTMATPVDLVHVHTVLYSKGGRQTRETNGMLCNKQSTSWVTDFHNFPLLQRRDFMVFSYDHILSPWIHHIIPIFPIQKSLGFLLLSFATFFEALRFFLRFSEARSPAGRSGGWMGKNPHGNMRLSGL